MSQPADTPNVHLPYGRNPRIDSSWTVTGTKSTPPDLHSIDYTPPTEEA